MRRASDRSIILPWERRGGLARKLHLSRSRPLVIVIAAIVMFIVIGTREQRSAGLRATRASLLVVHRAVDTYRADNGGKCPAELSELEKKGYLAKVPTDAWGRAFILRCPGRFDLESYELSSAGPDGEPGGLDRIE
jgi:general secretion pathway protein G